jgi:hypothetical protein
LKPSTCASRRAWSGASGCATSTGSSTPAPLSAPGPGISAAEVLNQTAATLFQATLTGEWRAAEAKWLKRNPGISLALMRCGHPNEVRVADHRSAAQLRVPELGQSLMYY